jgi:hypothetical protein
VDLGQISCSVDGLQQGNNQHKAEPMHIVSVLVEGNK